jgi:predicted house-cleaning noncanonical NTP pyrophosphatase (MazG superfamily)
MAGCTIVTPSEKEHSRVRRGADFGKLVRDKIPTKIAKRQEAEVSRKVPISIKKGFLISKLFEEALEVREARDKVLKTEELGDVYEVLRALANAEEISMTQITSAANAKKQKAGGFDEGFVLMQTGITSSGKADWSELDRVVSTLVPGQVSNGPAAIPFAFFGFMELDQTRAIYFEEMAVWLEITLRPDRLEINLSKAPEQLSLGLGQNEDDA